MPGSGRQEDVYTNYAGQEMLTDRNGAVTFTYYDASARATLVAQPSAVDTVDESKITFGQGGNTLLKPSDGLVKIIEYYPDGDAAAGYVEQLSLRNGGEGTDVPQETFDYDAPDPVSVDGVSIQLHPLLHDTVYRGIDSSEPSITSYDNQYSGLHLAERTTILPIIPVSQNGTGQQQTTVTRYDNMGRLDSTVDADGYTSSFGYDDVTGTVTRTDQEIGGGQADIIISVLSVDKLGRPLESVDGRGLTTSYHYEDAHDYSRTTMVPSLGAVSIIYTNNKLGYAEQRTEVSATDHRLLSLSRSYTDLGGRTVYADRYGSVSSAGFGYSETAVGPFGQSDAQYRTTYHYDVAGRQDQITDAAGTVTQTSFDDLDRPISLSIGTGTGLTLVQSTVYDNGNIGDGNATMVIQYPGGSSLPRFSFAAYDWRDRKVLTEDGYDSGVTTPRLTYQALDNLGEATETDVFEDPLLSISSIDPDAGVPDLPGKLRARSHALYDARGQEYRSIVDGINSSGQAADGSLTSDSFYDGRGDVVATLSPSGLFTKSAFDGAGRTVNTSSSVGGSPFSVSSGTILTETDNTYDADGNLIQIITRDRQPNGVLRKSSTVLKYDDANRLVTQAVFGTNPITNTLPSPGGGDGNETVLVTTHDYDFSTGTPIETITDPRGIVTKDTYDAVGRVTRSDQGYVNGVPQNDHDLITKFYYTPLGQILQQVVLTPGLAESASQPQTTNYIYGLANWGDNVVQNADSLHQVTYPDGRTDTYTYDGLGEITSQYEVASNTGDTTTLRQFGYDALGRKTSDKATGAGTVSEIDTAYNVLDQPIRLTTYNEAGAVTNQVERDYNGFGQVTEERQSPTGPVTPAKKVDYGYGPAASGSLPMSMTYPNSRVIHYNYTNSLDTAAGRVTSVTSGSEATPLESEQYLGVGTILNRTREEPGLTLATTLDAFSRVASISWSEPAKPSASSSIEFLDYRYDADSDVLSKQDHVNGRMSEVYTQDGAAADTTMDNGSPVAYDSLGQQVAFSRGTLRTLNNAPRPNATFDDTYQLTTPDLHGNWGSLVDGSTRYLQSPDGRNYYIPDATGMGASPGATAGVEGAATRLRSVDGFGRLSYSELKIPGNSVNGIVSGTGSRTFDSYDALGRITEEDQVFSTAPNLSSDRLLYYSLTGQVIEEDDAATGAVVHTYAYAPDGQLIARDDPASGGNSAARYYAIQDATGDITALTDRTGQVKERFYYLPGGILRVYVGSGVENGVGVVQTSLLQDIPAENLDWKYFYKGLRFTLADRLYELGNGQGYDPFARQVVSAATPARQLVSDPHQPLPANGFWESFGNELSHLGNIGAGLQIIGGLAEAAVGFLGWETGIGVAVGLHGIDNIVTGFQNLLGSGDSRTYTSMGIQGVAQFAGASEEDARMIGALGDAAVGIAGLAATGALSELQAANQLRAGLIARTAATTFSAETAMYAARLGEMENAQALGEVRVTPNLRDLALEVHNAAGPTSIRFRNSTVVVQSVITDVGPELRVASSSGYLTDAQYAAADRLGLIPKTFRQSRVPGVPRLHAEQILDLHLQPGESVEGWGISWGKNQWPVPCPQCEPLIDRRGGWIDYIGSNEIGR